jgi:hypothetical protein
MPIEQRHRAETAIGSDRLLVSSRSLGVAEAERDEERHVVPPALIG